MPTSPEQLDMRPWYERIDMLVRDAIRIAKDYQNPLSNDARGILDCYQLEDKLSECIKILSRYKEK